MKKIFNIKNYILLAVLFVNIDILFAAGDDSAIKIVPKIMLWLTLAIILFVLWLAVVYSEKNDNLGYNFKSFIKKVLYLLNPTPSLENEKDIMLDHEYDGIKELDNVVPPWFNFLFYGSILIGLIYMVHYHVVDKNWSSDNEYQTEVQAALLQREILTKSGLFIDENTVALDNSAGSLQSGKEVFLKNCASCHGNLGEGLVGPNLTDDYWINKGSLKDIFKVIKYGVPSKGMIAWETQLTPKQMQEVSNFILSLKGTKPLNAKAPEGELFVDKVDSLQTN